MKNLPTNAMFPIKRIFDISYYLDYFLKFLLSSPMITLNDPLTSFRNQALATKNSNAALVTRIVIFQFPWPG